MSGEPHGAGPHDPGPWPGPERRVHGCPRSHRTPQELWANSVHTSSPEPRGPAGGPRDSGAKRSAGARHVTLSTPSVSVKNQGGQAEGRLRLDPGPGIESAGGSLLSGASALPSALPVLALSPSLSLARSLEQINLLKAEAHTGVDGHQPCVRARSSPASSGPSRSLTSPGLRPHAGSAPPALKLQFLVYSLPLTRREEGLGFSHHLNHIVQPPSHPQGTTCTP